MLKDAGYNVIFELISPWMVEVLDVVKRELRAEHLKIDPVFCRRYFLGKSPNHLTSEEMAVAYSKDIAEGNVGLGEFIATRWLLKHTDVYGFFLERLKEINPDFESIGEIPEPMASTLMEEAILRFGAKKSYLFSIFNFVTFPSEVYKKFRERALAQTKELNEKKEKEEEAKSIEALKSRYEREILASNDRFEKKLSGLQKKYLADVASLKKQIGQLQRKLSTEKVPPA